MNEDCKRHEDQISNLYKLAKEAKESSHRQDIQLTELKSIAQTTSDRINNGLSATITKIYDTVKDQTPVIKELVSFKSRMMQGIMWITVIAVGGGLVALLFEVLKIGNI